MPVDPQILELLVCPENHGTLKPADPSLIEELNGRIRAGSLQTHGGDTVTLPLEEGLVRADGRCLYRVDDGIPNLLIDDRIDLV